ncbi:MAG: hypothetical protein ABI273_01800 [Lacunisphaera sp.]
MAYPVETGGVRAGDLIDLTIRIDRNQEVHGSRRGWFASGRSAVLKKILTTAGSPWLQ